MQATRGSIMPLAAEKRGVNAGVSVGTALVRQHGKSHWPSFLDKLYWKLQRIKGITSRIFFGGWVVESFCHGEAEMFKVLRIIVHCCDNFMWYCCFSWFQWLISCVMYHLNDMWIYHTYFWVGVACSWPLPPWYGPPPPHHRGRVLHEYYYLLCMLHIVQHKPHQRDFLYLHTSVYTNLYKL